ncbi:MAG: diguanylate cyclase [Halanaerobiales bacterium]
MQNKGFVIETTADLVIKNVIYDGTDFSFLTEGRILSSLINCGCREKVFEFSRQLNTGGAEFGYEINFNNEDAVDTFLLSGVKTDSDNLLILGSYDEGGIIDQYDYLMEINNNHVNKIRGLLKRQFKQLGIVIREQNIEDVFNELSSINNELIDLQRRLTKTNKELEEQKVKYYSTLKSIGEGVVTLDHQGRIEFINRVARETTGLSEKQTGKEEIYHYIDVIIDDDEVLEEIIDRTITGEESIRWDDVELRDTGGENIPVDLTASPIKITETESVGMVLVFKDISLRKEWEEEMRRMAVTDRLTGIMNRRMGLKFLGKQLAALERKGGEVSVCFLDVNGLKAVNDNFGHQEGDWLLKKTAEILNNTIRESDAAVRMGGDEFLLIFPDCNLQEAHSIYRRIQEQIERENEANIKEFNISLSSGFARKLAGDNLSLDGLIEKADEDMYKAKQQFYNESQS